MITIYKRHRVCNMTFVKNYIQFLTTNFSLDSAQIIMKFLSHVLGSLLEGSMSRNVDARLDLLFNVEIFIT